MREIVVNRSHLQDRNVVISEAAPAPDVNVLLQMKVWVYNGERLSPTLRALRLLSSSWSRIIPSLFMEHPIDTIESPHQWLQITNTDQESPHYWPWISLSITTDYPITDLGLLHHSTLIDLLMTMNPTNTWRSTHHHREYTFFLMEERRRVMVGSFMDLKAMSKKKIYLQID